MFFQPRALNKSTQKPPISVSMRQLEHSDFISFEVCVLLDDSLEEFPQIVV